MIKIQYTDPKLVSPHLGHVRPSVVDLGGRDKVQGVRQGAQGAAPSQREGPDVRAVFIGQLHNYCLPMRRGHRVGKVVGSGGWGGEVILNYYNVAMVYWLDRIFEISNHILENAFSQCKVSKIMLKLLINCL